MTTVFGNWLYSNMEVDTAPFRLSDLAFKGAVLKFKWHRRDSGNCGGRNTASSQKSALINPLHSKAIEQNAL